MGGKITHSELHDVGPGPFLTQASHIISENVVHISLVLQLHKLWKKLNYIMENIVIIINGRSLLE